MRRRLKANRTKIYRYKKKSNGIKPLLCKLKNKNFISNKVSEVLEVSEYDLD